MTEKKAKTPRRSFSKDEIAKIISLLPTHTHEEVAEIVGRPLGSLQHRFRKKNLGASTRLYGANKELRRSALILDVLRPLYKGIKSNVFSDVEKTHLEAMVEHILLMNKEC